MDGVVYISLNCQHIQAKQEGHRKLVETLSNVEHTWMWHKIDHLQKAKYILGF